MKKVSSLVLLFVLLVSFEVAAKGKYKTLPSDRQVYVDYMFSQLKPMKGYVYEKTVDGFDTAITDPEQLDEPWTEATYISDPVLIDLDQNGVMEAAVMVTEEGVGGGGNMVDGHIEIFSLKNGSLVSFTLEVGEANVSIDPKTKSIILAEPVFADDDPNCCPSMEKIYRLVYDSKKKGLDKQFIKTIKVE